MKMAKKIITILICPIVVHFLEIDENLNCLLGTIQTFFLQITTYIIITIISKFGQFFLKYGNIYFSIILAQKN
jgi:hypothetical protein